MCYRASLLGFYTFKHLPIKAAPLKVDGIDCWWFYGSVVCCFTFLCFDTLWATMQYADYNNINIYVLPCVITWIVHL